MASSSNRVVSSSYALPSRISSSCLRIWRTRSNVAEADLTDVVVLTRAMAIELFDIVKHKVEDARHTQGS